MTNTPITDLPEPPSSDLEGLDYTTPSGNAKPKIAGWVDALPKGHRSTEFDPVIDAVRSGAPGHWAIIEIEGRPISSNRLASLKKRYADIQFKHISGVVYATKR